MLDYNWLNKGTIYFKRRSENTFNVIPGSSILLGLLDPLLATHTYGFDREYMDAFLDKLVESFNYDKNLLCYPNARFEHRYGEENEATFLVRSQTKDKEYKSTLRNINRHGIEAQLKSLRNLKHTCKCERGLETDILCSMPLEACKIWGISEEQYNRNYEENDKIYGEKICKHEVRDLSLLGYSLFDKYKFHKQVLPLIIKDLSKLETLKQENLDVAVRANLSTTGWFEALEYIRQLHRLEEKLKIAEIKLN